MIVSSDDYLQLIPAVVKLERRIRKVNGKEQFILLIFFHRLLERSIIIYVEAGTRWDLQDRVPLHQVHVDVDRIIAIDRAGTEDRRPRLLCEPPSAGRKIFPRKSDGVNEPTMATFVNGIQQQTACSWLYENEIS